MVTILVTKNESVGDDSIIKDDRPNRYLLSGLCSAIVLIKNEIFADDDIIADHRRNR